MIQATFNKKNDFIDSFKIKGHAGYAEHGEDIICASVSSLAISVINTLEEYVKAKIKYSVKEADVSLNIIKVNDTQKIQADALTKMLMIAVKEMSEEHSQYIKVKIMEE